MKSCWLDLSEWLALECLLNSNGLWLGIQLTLRIYPLALGLAFVFFNKVQVTLRDPEIVLSVFESEPGLMALKD